MSLFASNDENRLLASELATTHVSVWNQCLGLRIRMQQLLDLSNSFPVVESTFNDEKLVPNLLQIMDQIVSSSNDNQQQNYLRNLSRKRQRDEDVVWDYISTYNDSFTPQWKEVLDKWYGRSHFGSEKKASKLRSFNTSLWAQIQDIISDNRKVIEKTRIKFEESTRVGKECQSDRDIEVYDDRQFYSMLLKTFITSTTGDDGMRPQDLNLLRKLKSSKNQVDRKASKGRRIRYIEHPKIQNFMFPVAVSNPAIDVDKLFQSLFQ